MSETSMRRATAADVPGLVALERLAPEAGPVAVRIEFHGDYLALGGRLGQPEVYIAEAAGAVVGTLSAVTGRTRLNDGWAPTTYLFRLRVHPAWRRRGVAAQLVEHAWAEARREHDTLVAWGGVLARNRASLGLARAMGFEPVRTLGFRVLPTRWPAVGLARRVLVRPAQVADWPDIAQQAEVLYGRCQFWPGVPPWPEVRPPRPLNAGGGGTEERVERSEERVGTEERGVRSEERVGGIAPGGIWSLAPPTSWRGGVAHRLSPPGERNSTSDETWVWAADGGVRASAAVFDLGALATVRVIAQYPGLGAATALLARLGGLPDLAGPLRVGLVRDLTFAPERPADGAALVGALARALRGRLDFLIVAGDPAHPAGRVLRRLPWGMPGRVVLVARALAALDPRRPAYFALA
jgi:GNAT superfamily N-acetyltransferase